MFSGIYLLTSDGGVTNSFDLSREWWPERESNPQHEDFQWRAAKFPTHFQLVAKIKSGCATECATPIGKLQVFAGFRIAFKNRMAPYT